MHLHVELGLKSPRCALYSIENCSSGERILNKAFTMLKKLMTLILFMPIFSIAGENVKDHSVYKGCQSMLNKSGGSDYQYTMGIIVGAKDGMLYMLESLGFETLTGVNGEEVCRKTLRFLNSEEGKSSNPIFVLEMMTFSEAVQNNGHSWDDVDNKFRQHNSSEEKRY